jgi:peptidoglycan/xylan/chitin deacetylase (PgdA/CDA1 family)
MATDLDELLALTETLLREPEAPPRLPFRAPVPPPRPVRSARPAPVVAPLLRPSRKRPITLVGSLVLVLLLVPGIAPRVRVQVDGHAVLVYSNAPTVEAALRRAGIVPRDGALLAIKTRAPIDAHFDPAIVLRNHRPVDRDAALRADDRIAVRNGYPRVEGVVARTVAIDGGGLPAIEYGLWRLPTAGSSAQLAGERSGEVVSTVEVARAVAAAPVSEPVVALSFDDGPHPDTTPAILAILRAAGIKATFCVVGYAAQRYPELVKAIHDEGHTLCNHTMHHVQKLGDRPANVITEELRDVGDLVERSAGVRPSFFRAPGGTWAPNLIDEVHHQGMRALGWNVDPADFERPGAAVITNRVMAQLRPGAVILLHDGGGDRSQTVAQLGALIERLRAHGYGFAVPAL